jgi:hypothetical protein
LCFAANSSLEPFQANPHNFWPEFCAFCDQTALGLTVGQVPNSKQSKLRKCLTNAANDVPIIPDPGNSNAGRVVESRPNLNDGLMLLANWTFQNFEFRFLQSQTR